MKDFDPKRFKELQDTAKDLKEIYAGRDALLDEMTEAYTLKWGEEADFKKRFQNVYATKAPDARDKVQGGIRLLSANECVASVPRNMQSDIDEDLADKIEKDATAMLRASDRIQGIRLLRDIAKSALIWDEIHISVTSTKDMVKHLEGMGDKAGKAVLARAKAAQRVTPFLFRALDPRSGYPDMDELGLRAYMREAQMYPKEIEDRYGEEGTEALRKSKGKTPDAKKKITVVSYWDLDTYACWLEKEDRPIRMEEYGLPFIPIVCKLVEGSLLFSNMDEQREPFLYTFVKSGMWNRLNLGYTALYTSVAAVGLFPTLVYKGNPANQIPTIDTTLPWGVIRLSPEESLESMLNKGIIDPGLMQAIEIAERKGMESTIYNQTLGQPLGAGASFSETALLHQAGRLPLTSAKERMGWSIADALKMAMMWMKEETGKHKVAYENYYSEIDPSEIPETLEIEVDVDVALPTDNLQMANVFGKLEGKISDEWLLDNIMNIKQPKQMFDDILTEQATKALFGAWIQKKVMELTQPPQPPMQEQMPQEMPPNMDMSAPPGMMPPEEGPMPMQGLPPVMGQGGGQPPMMPPGTGGLPPEEEM